MALTLPQIFGPNETKARQRALLFELLCFNLPMGFLEAKDTGTIRLSYRGRNDFFVVLKDEDIQEIHARVELKTHVGDLVAHLNDGSIFYIEDLLTFKENLL